MVAREEVWQGLPKDPPDRTKSPGDGKNGGVPRPPRPTTPPERPPRKISQ